MGGLALGAYLFGRWVDRVADPLALYLRLEIAIGILGAAYPLCFEPIRDLFVWAARAMELAPGGMRLASILAAALTVLVPTTLMGGTLPVLGRYLIRTEESIGRQISNLYYLNSFGAVAGSLVTGVLADSHGRFARVDVGRCCAESRGRRAWFRAVAQRRD
jgi:spermidine synthase